MIEKMFRWLMALVVCVLTTQLYAQTAAPHVSGNVYIRMADGLIRCEFEISNLPPLGQQYKLLLHRGMNIKLLGDSTGVLNYDGHYGGKMNGEGVEYVPKKGRQIAALPGKLRISYTGAYPVYGDTLMLLITKG